MGTTSLDARIRQAERRLAADAGVLVEEYSVPLPGADGTARVVAAGEGQPYLLLHGAALSVAWWIPLMPHLPGRLVAVDLPGHGLSDAHDPRAGTLRTVVVNLVTTLLDRERLEQAVLVGHSLGGAAALWTALDAPGRTSRIVLISDAGPALPGNRQDPLPGPLCPVAGGPVAVQGPPDGYAAALGRRLQDPAIEHLPDLAAATYYSALRQLPGTALRPMLRDRWSGPDLLIDTDDLRRIDVPVRCLRGRADAVHPIEPVRAAIAAIPRAGLQFVAGGHAPWLANPASVGAAIHTAIPAADRPRTSPRTPNSATRTI
ncbi:MAG TPA: alpha/beta hydrolase [Catenuloplanes sp.]|jgi:pimeloyl-ACP methyl ester carboxylesterase